MKKYFCFYFYRFLKFQRQYITDGVVKGFVCHRVRNCSYHWEEICPVSSPAESCIRAIQLHFWEGWLRQREKSSDRRQKPSHTKPFVCGVYWGIVSASEHDWTCLHWVRVDTLRTFGQGEFKQGGSRPVPLRDVLYFTVRPRPRG